MRRAVDTAEGVLDRARADPQDVLDAVRNIRAECGAATTALYRDGSVSLRKALADAVLSYSKAQTLRDRSWLLAMGFDSPQSGIPPIDQFLADDATVSTSSVVSDLASQARPEKWGETSGRGIWAYSRDRSCISKSPASRHAACLLGTVGSEGWAKRQNFKPRAGARAPQ